MGSADSTSTSIDADKRRRKRRAGSKQNAGRRFGIFSRLRRTLETVSHWRLLTAFPLFSYLLLSAIYALAVKQAIVDVSSFPVFWTPGADESEAEKLSAELVKQKLQFFGYAITLFLLLFRVRQCVSFFKREITLIFMIIVLALTVLSTDYPDRVVINLIHLVFGILATWIYFNEKHRRENIVFSAGLITFVAALIPLCASALLFFAHDQSSLEAIVAGKRFSGLSGNPNTLGGVCIIGAWATFTLMTLTRLKSKRMLLMLLAVGVIVFNAWATGSATTLAIILVIAILIVASRFYNLFGKKAKAGLILGTTLLLFAGVFTLVVQQNVDDYALAATEAVGKDLTFTGRTDLWFVAWEAFVERPVLGWGYDNHQTVLETNLYSVPYNHYHNGFLDSLVSGGALFGIAILLSYFAFFTRYLSFRSVAYGGFPLVVAVVAVSVQNFTEYSMFRNNSAIWQVYFISFIAVSMATVKSRNRSKAAKPVEQKVRSSRRMRW